MLPTGPTHIHLVREGERVRRDRRCRTECPATPVAGGDAAPEPSVIVAAGSGSSSAGKALGGATEGDERFVCLAENVLLVGERRVRR